MQDNSSPEEKGCYLHFYNATSLHALYVNIDRIMLQFHIYDIIISVAQMYHWDTIPCLLLNRSLHVKSVYISSEIIHKA